MSERRIVHRVCPFCEVRGGLSVEIDDGSIVSVRGNKEAPFSRGFICPKAHGLKAMYHDPDRCVGRCGTQPADGVKSVGRKLT
jgi:anaerobic selenocysteine-containing dehydrogenase